MPCRSPQIPSRRGVTPWWSGHDHHDKDSLFRGCDHRSESRKCLFTPLLSKTEFFFSLQALQRWPEILMVYHRYLHDEKRRHRAKLFPLHLPRRETPKGENIPISSSPILIRLLLKPSMILLCRRMLGFGVVNVEIPVSVRTMDWYMLPCLCQVISLGTKSSRTEVA